MSPAATVAASSILQSAIRNPQSLLLDFLTGEVPTEVILADHNLTPDQFLAWIESAETQHQLDSLAKIDAARAKAIAATSRADALHSLRRVLVQSKSLGEIRRAASAILRYDAAAHKVPRLEGSAPSRSKPATELSTPAPAASKPPKPPEPTSDAEDLAANLAIVNRFLAKADAGADPASEFAALPLCRSAASSHLTSPPPSTPITRSSRLVPAA